MKQIIKYPDYFVTEEGKVFSNKTKKFLKPSYDKQGYARIGIYVGNYRTKTIKIHRLIAEAFISNPLNKTDVNHIDGNKSNNFVINLEWCTRSENCKHAFKTGLSKISDKHKNLLSKRAKKYIGGNNPAARKVINCKTNIIYATVSEAALHYGLKRTTLIAMLNGQNKNKTDLKYYE
jgi:hypothetical protein